KCQNINFDNGYFTSGKKTFHLQEMVSYSCHTGFVTPEGQETGVIQCQENGWTPPPKCITIECEMLTLANGDFSPKEGKYRNGDVVKFTCANNYVRVGPPSTQCYYFGWFPSPPVCKVSVRGCGPPPEITDGNIAGGIMEQYRHGDRKQYECNIKFKLVGSKEIECVDGQWSSPPSCIDPSPRCVLPRDVELLPSGRVSKQRKETGFRRVIRYRCTSADKTIKQATCVSGKWLPEIQ
ncbi:PREDICTED: coagulation factor XIII B chain-like, partial [Tauraco erythrolophus]|uniref:coagulation factor XIII B chain-like n=1 Tax=Tauraco erythrolophus TaxID=121530 RepID=UPI000523EB29